MGIVQFINQRVHSPPTTILFPELNRRPMLLAHEAEVVSSTVGADLAQPLASVLPRPLKDIFAYPKVGRGPWSTTRSSLNPGRVKASKISTGFFYRRQRPEKASMGPFSVTFRGRSLVNNF